MSPRRPIAAVTYHTAGWWRSALSHIVPLLQRDREQALWVTFKEHPHAPQGDETSHPAVGLASAGSTSQGLEIWFSS